MDVPFLQELFSRIAERGREQPAGASPAEAPRGVARLSELCHALLSVRGEASGIALAREVAATWRALGAEERLRFFHLLQEDFGPPRAQLREAAARYLQTGSPADERALMVAAEPQRQELMRRINLAPGNTAQLVAMRAHLLGLLAEAPGLAEVDADFVHLLSSWFNRGFLVLRRIDWSTPASILERLIRYERVHPMHGWDDLRRRIEPIDRRCYAFFHPALVDEPLIFVQVALTREVAGAVGPLLAENRPLVPPAEQTTAVFYSISNTQKGLQGITFGNFLIKQVAEDIKREVPTLATFVTLSPAPGFAAWLSAERARPDSTALRGLDAQVLAALDEPGWTGDPQRAGRLREVLLPLAARYFLEAKNRAGRPADPVARFHLGNGARLERLNWPGDTSPKGLRESHGLMVNYLYALADVERNHEAYSNEGVVVASPAVHALRAGAPGGGEPHPEGGEHHDRDPAVAAARPAS